MLIKNKNRKFKFRIWDKRRKEMTTKGLNFDYTEEYGISSIYDSHERIVELFTIMQFTGLKDIKKKEIYEGDIVLDTTNGKGGKYEIRYRNSGFMGISNEGDDYGLYTLNLYINDENPKLEVIGNIYENPELK